MNSSVDLRQLAAPRPANTRRVVHRNRLVWVTRVALPILLLGGFCGALAYSFREVLLPAKTVTVIPVISVRAEIQQPEAALFQSAGWVEARPTPVVVSALEEGVVEELLVIEGQELVKGQAIARLIDADARLGVRDATAELDSRRAELASGKAALAAAEIRLREPIELETKLAEAEAVSARVENELSRLPSQVKAAEARLELAEKETLSKTNAGEALSQLTLARAVNEQRSAQAALMELEAQRLALVKEQAAQERRVVGLKRQLELKVEEQRQHDEAIAAVDLATARLAQAQVALDTAELKLKRMEIRAPSDGKVLALVARPGTKVMGLAPASMPDASTVITMYDPARLQIRADVRLEEVPRVFPGQQVVIETPAVRGKMSGTVIAATSLTDIQKNTLQVKVAVSEPPAVIKPDMLVQVTFLSPASKQLEAQPDAPLTLVIPPDVAIENGDQVFVWVADRQLQMARLQAITLGGVTADGMHEVKSGLAVGDRLIADGKDTLRDGERIRVIGEASERPPAGVSGHQHAPTKMKRL